MIIEIRSDVFEDITNLAAFNYLLKIISYNYRYEFFADFTEIFETELYQNLHVLDQEIIAESFNRHVSESTNADYQVEHDSDDNSFNLAESIRFFSQPLTIMLENSLNDGYFVDALISNFKQRSRKIKRHKQAGWLNYGMGGGAGNIENALREMLRQFEGLPKERHQYLRCFVLIDSDKEFPRMPMKKDRNNLLSFLENNGIPYHVLEKREMENYIPDEAIELVENKAEYIHAYLRLEPIQKDYFDIEKSLPDINRTSLHAEIQKLYASVSDQDYAIFRKNNLISSTFKSEFPKLFRQEKVTQETLKSRVKHQKDPNELERILDKINELI